MFEEMTHKTIITFLVIFFIVCAFGLYWFFKPAAVTVVDTVSNTPGIQNSVETESPTDPDPVENREEYVAQQKAVLERLDPVTITQSEEEDYRASQFEILKALEDGNTTESEDDDAPAP